MLRFKYSPIALAALAAMAAGMAQAQGTEAVKTLETVNVIGTLNDLQSLDFYAPNSTAVLSRDDIKAQGGRKLDQALQYQAGIVSEPYGGDNKVEWFKIRGFDASTALDGAPTTPNGFFVWKPELYGVESVEVVKGANSLLFGAASSGGVVNLVTKRPHKEESLTLDADVGNYGQRGLGFDYNGVANPEGTAYYRLVAQARHQDGTQTGSKMDSYYLAPSVTMELNRSTSLTLMASVQREDGVPTNGFLPAYGTIIGTPYGYIDRSTSMGEPDREYLKRTQTSVGWLFSHKFDNNWTFTQNYKFTQMDLDQLNVFAWSSDNNRQAYRGYAYTNGTTSNHYLDNRMATTLRWGDVELSPVVGLDYLHSDTRGLNNGFGGVPNLDMFAPVYGAPFTVTGSAYQQQLNQWGTYASAGLKLGSNWKFNAGIRHDEVRQMDLTSGKDNTSHDSFNLGAMYVSSMGIAPYVSYSESFKPVVGTDGYGKAYKPYEGKQTEVGVKLEPIWLDGTITLAVFNLEEKNALASDASNVQTQVGKRTNNGLELSTDFKVADSTSIKATYTHNDSKYDLSTVQTLRTPLIPESQASLWVSHRFAQPLTVAAGVRYNGSTVDERYYLGKTIDAYTVMDLMARYELDRSWTLQMNVRNLADKTYVSGCDFYCYYGAGRTVDVQLQYAVK